MVAVAVSDMSRDQYEDFVSEMYTLVQEEGYLWEAPGGVTDVSSRGDVVHGPWRQEDCAWLLLGWYEAGLLAIYTLKPSEPDAVVPAELALQFLSQQAAWTTETAHVLLHATAEGQALDYARWQVSASADRRRG